MEVVLHDPVVISSTVSERVLAETELIRVMEAGTGYYLGTMTGRVADHHGASVSEWPFNLLGGRSRGTFGVRHRPRAGTQHEPAASAWMQSGKSG